YVTEILGLWQECVSTSLYFLVILLVKGNGNNYKAPSTPTPACCSASGVAQTSERAASFDALSALQDLEGISRPPLQRSQFSCSDPLCNGGVDADGLDVWFVQKDAVAKRMSWEYCAVVGNQHKTQSYPAQGSAQQWQGQPRTKSPRQRNRPKSRKKHKQDASQWSPYDSVQGPVLDQGGSSWPAHAPWYPHLPVSGQKGNGKGCMPLPMNMASPPPPPPPMLMAQQHPHGVPWMQQPMPAMSAMPFMPPSMDAPAVPPPPTATLPPEVAADAKGKDSEREFHTRHIGLNDVHSDVAPHKCPAYEGQNRAGRQAAPSASAGSSSNRHFLDRRLPADVPSYIHHLQHLWRDDLCRPPLDQPYQLRTWYIHHVHQPQWKVPRLVALPGDGTAWHQLILERWRDQIHNDAVLNIAVVFPQVRSTFDTVPVHADLILVQGGPNFCGGLTTVHPPGDDTGRGYTWAASYPRHVGGVGILVGVDAEELLQTHACDVFHAGISIPTTTAPSHWMSNGHSFVAVFQDLQGARTTVPTPAIPTASPTAESGEVGEDLTDLSPGTLALSPEAAEESPQVSDSSFDEEELQGVQIFQLGRSVHHCFLRWRTYNFVLFDMLHAIGLHRDMAIGFHVLQAPLIDQHHAEEAVILQRVGDIPAASDSKLVLLDLVIESPTSGPVHPLRETRLLPRLITRLGLVHALGLRSMCDVDDSIAGCVVYYNNVLWEATNIEVRTIDHGAYLRIIVPQRHDQLVEEPRLKRTIQQCTPEASAGSAKFSRGTRPSTRPDSVDVVEEEGPVLYVWTWFIHHGLFPRCREPRIVRLDRKHDNWLRDLLAPWDFACQRATQTQVSIVHPQPPHDALHMETVHVMIEQTPREPVAAAVISIIYHEGPADRLHQEARSLPRWLCTDDLIDIMDLHPICDFQKCTARIGRVPFQQFIRDDIPTATGIELHVKPVFCEGDHTAASSNQPYLPRPLLPAVGRSLMQTVRRWQRTRLLVQPAEDVVPGEHLADEYHMTPQRVADCASLGHHLQPAAFPMWPTSWTTLHEVWTFYFAQTAAPEGMTIRAAVWYSDHVRRPWSEDCRTVTLDANLDLWHAHLVAAWEDWMLPDRQIEIVVVRPVPLGANEDAHFHVIILQQPQPMTKTVILTVMDAFADPWHPGQVCLTVPNAVDHWMLLHAAAVEFQCPPAVPNSRCTTSFGHTDLTAGNLFPVQHGMCFTVTVEGSLEPVLPLPLDDAADPAHDPSAHGVSLLQLHAKFCRVRLSSQVLAAQTQQLLQVFDDVMVELSPTTVPRPLSVHAGCGDTIEAVPQLTSSSTSPVVLSLQATLTPAGDLDAPTYQDELSALQWLHQPNWEAKCAQLSELPLMPLPDGVQIPLESYAAMMDPTLAPAASTFQAQTHGPNKIRWDADRLRDPSVVAEFQAALATLPLPTWDVNVDEHCRLYETNLLQLARQYFEKRTFKRKRPQLSGRTLQCIAFKRHLLDCGRAWNLMHDELFKQELKLVEKEVRALVRGDLQIYYDQILVQLQNAGELHDLKAVFRLLTRLGSKKIKSGTSIRPLPALRKNDGTLATSFTEQQQVWMQQFSEIEAGVPLHWEVLQRLDRPGLGPPKDIQCQELFPSPWELQLALKKLKRGKVPGQNQLPPDVLKAGAAPLCHQLCALTTKVVAHCKEPLEWKGGQLIPLSKGKPDAADPTGYRSIFISDFTAKMFHMTMRNYLVQVWENGIQSLQLGGRKRMGVDFAHHFLQAHRHWTASRKLPSAYLFFDIKSAFYSVLRQALFPDEAPSLSLIAALSRFRVSADDIDGMLQAVRRDDAT
ncbi:unnamed protein product, partial [Cladocopium goreaui]